MNNGRNDTDREGRPATILVVDDDTAVRQAAVWVIEMFGYAIREAANGDEALEALRQDPTIDLMFTDVVMPLGMNGIELAEAALEIRSNLKVVLTTGHAEAEMNALSESGFRLLSKPYSNDVLAGALKEALEE